VSGGGRDPGAAALESQLDDLYRSPLDQFVARRDALAKSLRAAGDAGSAARVKALRKPSVVAWAINRLHLERQGLREIEAASAALRAALQHPRSAAERRDAIESRRRALEAATTATVAMLEEAGSAVSPELLRRVERTLLAVASGPASEGAEAPVPGRLDQDLEPPGFEALLGAPMRPASTLPTASAERRSGTGDTGGRAASRSARPAAARSAGSRSGSAKTAQVGSDGPPAKSPGRPPAGRSAASRPEAPPKPAGSAAARSNVRDLAHEKAVRAAQQALDDAEGELERATDQVEAARMRVIDAEKALAASRLEVDAARRELAAVRSRRDQARRDLDRARAR
jgi:hypothetical protein